MAAAPSCWLSTQKIVMQVGEVRGPYGFADLLVHATVEIAVHTAALRHRGVM
jgi:hypothetical protein